MGWQQKCHLVFYFGALLHDKHFDEKLASFALRFQNKGSCQKKKNVFFWEIFPKCGWVGWLIPKQGPNPSKPPQIPPKIAFFDPNFTFRFPKSHKNPGVGGCLNRFGKGLPKKTDYFFDPFPKLIW